jgi:hypothetical protein
MITLFLMVSGRKKVCRFFGDFFRFFPGCLSGDLAWMILGDQEKKGNKIQIKSGKKKKKISG